MTARVGPAAVAADLARARTEVAAVAAAWRAFVGALPDDVLARRPAPGRWSPAEHLAHLVRVDESYLPYLDRMLGDAAVAPGATADARETRLSRWLAARAARRLIRLTEPPVRLKVRTTAAYVPDPPADRDVLLATFEASRRALEARADAAGRLDPARLAALRARYAPGIGPAGLVTLRFAEWLALVAAHDRRHLWLAERGVGGAA